MTFSLPPPTPNSHSFTHTHTVPTTTTSTSPPAPPGSLWTAERPLAAQPTNQISVHPNTETASWAADSVYQLITNMFTCAPAQTALRFHFTTAPAQTPSGLENAARVLNFREANKEGAKKMDFIYQTFVHSFLHFIILFVSQTAATICKKNTIPRILFSVKKQRF